MTRHNEGLGNKPIIVIIGLIASCIAVFSFLTGWQSIFEIFRRNPSTPQPTARSYSTLPPYTGARECASYDLAGEWDSIENCYTNIIAQHPDDFWAHYFLATAYGNQRKHQLAIETGRQMLAIAKTPEETAQSLLTIGINYNYLGEYSAAINHLLVGSQIESIDDSRRADFSIWLAWSYQEDGQIAEACNYFRQTLDLAERTNYEWAIDRAQEGLQSCP